MYKLIYTKDQGALNISNPVIAILENQVKAWAERRAILFETPFQQVAALYAYCKVVALEN